MHHVLKCATHLAQDNVCRCLNTASEMRYRNTLVPTKNIIPETNQKELT